MIEIRISDFSVRRGSFCLKPVNLRIEAGEIFGILGRTGSGKSVLLEAAAGMFPGDTGVITYGGTDVTKIPPGERKIGFVTQEHGLFPHMTVEQNIRYGLRMHRVPKEEQKRKAQELEDLFSIGHLKNQYPGTLSGGESQRTALARALAVKPDLLLLDEPFSALDPSTRQSLYREIQNIHRKFGCTILFVTHDFSEAELLADRVGILLDGELQAVTEGKNLMQGHYNEKVEEFLGRKQ